MSAPAASRYRGLRLTITEAPGSDKVWVTLAVKGWADRWDRWTHLLPAVRFEADTSLGVDVVHLLRVALTEVEGALSDDD